MLCLRQHDAAFRHLVHIEEDRQQVDVGERERAAHEIAGRAHRRVEHCKLRAHVGQRGLDRFAIRTAVGSVGEEIGAQVTTQHHRIDVCVDERDPLLDERGGRGIRRHQRRARKRPLDVQADCAGLAQRDGTVSRHRNLAEGMDRTHFGCLRQGRNERVRHALLDAGDAGSPDEVAGRCADDLQVAHDWVLSLTMEIARERRTTGYRIDTDRHDSLH